MFVDVIQTFLVNGANIPNVTTLLPMKLQQFVVDMELVCHPTTVLAYPHGLVQIVQSPLALMNCPTRPMCVVEKEVVHLSIIATAIQIILETNVSSRLVMELLPTTLSFAVTMDNVALLTIVLAPQVMMDPCVKIIDVMEFLLTQPILVVEKVSAFLPTSASVIQDLVISTAQWWNVLTNFQIHQMFAVEREIAVIITIVLASQVLCQWIAV